MYKDISSIEDYNTGIDAIKASIKNILLTPKGGLPGKPDFGSNLHLILFQQINSLTASMIQKIAEEAIRKYDPRIYVTEVNVRNIEEYNKIIVNVKYTYNDTKFTTEEIEDSVSVSIDL